MVVKKMKTFVNNRKIIFIVALLVVVLLVGWNKFGQQTKKTVKEVVHTVKKETIKQTLTITGVLDAKEKVTLRFQNSGLLAWVRVKEGDVVTGIKVRAKVVKNKVAPPFRTAEFDIMFSEGISKEGSLIDVGVEMGIIKKSGAWYEYGSQKLGQGREAAKASLKADKKLLVEIDKKVRDTVAQGKDAVPLQIGGEDAAKEQ